MLLTIKSLISFFENFLIHDKLTVILLTISSVLLFLISLFVIPYIVSKIPEDYFTHEKRVTQKGVGFFITRIIKNILGFIFLFFGFIMLFTPGPGLLTMAIGFTLLNFPGKYKMEKRIIRNKAIYKEINRIRKKFNKPPLLLK
jgi:archaellum biogenesis protein FlaJ (TadC family)